ncbi:MAG: putative glucose inhibited division protein, partial [Bacteriovoracaceae bacterium]|nr:putative glucose inhibited division protein [Bacteriovoracaceae bacterium]
REFSDYSKDDLSFVETEIKYEGYIEQTRAQVRQMERYENLMIPTDFNFQKLSGLPIESIEKLSAIRPLTLGQAGRISGITPATVSILAIHLNKKNRDAESKNVACVSSRNFDVMNKDSNNIFGEGIGKYD